MVLATLGELLISLHLLAEQQADQSSNGWGASAIDALSTALIMQIPEIVNQIVDYVPDIDWSVSADNEPVSLFETTIRYVAGLLSGYDLLNGPLSNLVDDVSRFPPAMREIEILTNFPSSRKAKSIHSSSKPPTLPTT